MMTLGNRQKASVGKVGHLPTKISSSKQPMYDPLTSRTTPTDKEVVLMQKAKNSKLSDKTTKAELITIKPEQMAPSGSESSLDSLRKRDSSSTGVYVITVRQHLNVLSTKPKYERVQKLKRKCLRKKN